MLKLKIATASLALAGLVLLLMGEHIPHHFLGCALHSHSIVPGSTPNI